MKKIKVSGLIGGKPVTIECVERNNRIEVYKNGREDFSTEIEIAVLIADENDQRENLLPDGEIDPTAIESYLLVLREHMFDKPPEIETEGIDGSSLSSLSEEEKKYIDF